ncbi:MAG: hypothetical protein KF851_02640 [Pirellulaceae bacterium]|nr:hypothetical protein [Pirellulaceae bacterium]
MEDLIILLSELEERPAVEVANDMAFVHRRDEIFPPASTGFFDILKKHIRVGQSEQNAEQQSRILSVLAENVELELGGGKTIAVALLMHTCAKMHAELQEPRVLLWRLAEWAGIFLKNPTPAKLDELYQIAVSSSPDSYRLFEWLNANRAEDAEVPDQSKEMEGFSSIDRNDL